MKRLMMLVTVAAATLLAPFASAGETRWDVLTVYRLADGQGVAVAYPGEWREVSKTRVLEAGAPARFIDESGRRVEIPAEALARAAGTKAVARPEGYRRVAFRTH